jgi:hypothetical protein
MNGVNYTTALNNTMQFSQTGVMSRLTPLLKAIAVITVAFIAIGAVYLAITHGVIRRQTQAQKDHSSSRVTPQPNAVTPQPDTVIPQPDAVIPQPEIDKTIPPISRSATDKKIQITIKTLQAKTFNMDVYPSDTIRHLQDQICEYYKNLNEHPNDIRSTNRDYHQLLYQGKKLEQGRILSDYGINHDKCMLYVIHRTCR